MANFNNAKHFHGLHGLPENIPAYLKVRSKLNLRHELLPRLHTSIDDRIDELLYHTFVDTLFFGKLRQHMISTFLFCGISHMFAYAHYNGTIIFAYLQCE
ncbi:hypothetical protein SDC9_178180 [bioreactor metagenome]|uniref:Uncharacterized protein n=1 Tax=bioreactor metagenome TaxID=1076179 RepID=A0A645GY91_9ZZZZ